MLHGFNIYSRIYVESGFLMEIDDLTCISIASHFQSQVVINSLKGMQVFTLVLMATGVYIHPSRIEVGTVIFKFTSPPIQPYLFNFIFGAVHGSL